VLILLNANTLPDCCHIGSPFSSYMCVSARQYNKLFILSITECLLQVISRYIYAGFVVLL